MSKNQDSKINKESSTQKLEPEKLENINATNSDEDSYTNIF